ncbi:hypothetical protein DJ031_04510 [bacterium endosymbiont of Escarpia laminata]|nr:MAG: hypothetical protein DJ031_04510 [bacterium endosymbiont of Escarpia laminata]
MSTATLASLQEEREKLRAARAKEDFEEYQVRTCTKNALTTAGIRSRKAMLDMLDKLTNRLVEAIDGQHDETRVHYHMSDTVHDLLSQFGETVEKDTQALPLIGRRIKMGATPREIISVSKWADKYRWLKSGTNAPGKWDTNLTPYMREIMDNLSEHSPVRQITFIKSAGVGGTEALYNWIGYIMHHLQNKDLLLVVPTLDLRDRSFNPRLAKMIDETPALKELVNTSTRNRTNRENLLEYGARARIIKAGANSPDSLRADHLPYVICDEIDAFPWDVGGEGDPMTLIENRQRTYSRAKTYLVSTPTIEHTSRIDMMYRRSDRRRYHVPCPHCGEYQPLEFKQLQWKKTLPAADIPEHEQLSQVEKVWYACKVNGCVIEEGHKTGMLAAGRWIAERPAIKLHRGYHLNALYAPIGLGLGWKAVAQKWLNSQNDTSEMKGFINTYLGEVWTEQGDSIDDYALIARLEIYPKELEFETTTAGVDVQKDRLEATIVGWQADEEAWVMDHLIIPGETTQQHVWNELDQSLRDAKVDLAAIDSGYNTSMVKEFVAKRAWTIAIKGMPGISRPLVDDEGVRRQRLRNRRRRGIPIEPIGVDQGKALIYARVKLPKPGPGYIHFPNTPAFDTEYFAQLAAEKLVTKVRGTRPYQEWVQTRSRNETLDCLNYALAARRMVRVKPAKTQNETPHLPTTIAPMMPDDPMLL